MIRRLYHTPHAARPRESRFAEVLCGRLGATRVDTSFPTPEAFLQVSLDAKSVAAALLKDAMLPETRRQQCLVVLKALPERIFVARQAKDISFDCVVEEDHRLFFWEFHEEQHRTLKDARPKRVFGSDGAPYEVPRYLQRLLRDVWRAQSAKDLTVVWWDWFEQQEGHFSPQLLPGFHEFRVAGTFGIGQLCAV